MFFSSICSPAHIIIRFALYTSCIILFPVFSYAVIKPANGSALNYRQVMFEYDEVKGATEYIITVYPIDAQGNAVKKESLRIKNTSLAYIATFPAFGKNYNWYYEAFEKKKSIFKSPVYSFNILTHVLIDTSLYRSKLEISKKGAFDNDIVFIDYLGTAIDREGKPIWFYPSILADGKSAPNYRNMRMTKDGTITFQDNSECYEVNTLGELVWKTPNDGKISGDATEYYHHDFRKLSDGTYMTSSYKFVEQPNFYNNAVMSKVRYNTLIQYDAAGKVVWSWNEGDHIGIDVLFRGHSASETNVEGTHLNGFDCDEKENTIVISCRNNSSVFKIDKKTGNVIYDLGIYNMRSRKQGSGPWFKSQHGPVILPDHQVMIYNNNATDDTTGGPRYPHVMIIKEPHDTVDALKTWDFECKSPRYPKGIIGKEGYATPLPNGNILVCMGGANYSFEVTYGKEVVWQCMFERYDDQKKEWVGFNNYRSNFASSLYPEYFTLQYGPEKKGMLQVKINNEGTDNGQYKVQAVLQNGYTQIFSDTVSIKGRNAQLVKINLDPKYLNENIIVLVTSFSNTETSKLLEFKKQ